MQLRDSITILGVVFYRHQIDILHAAGHLHNLATGADQAYEPLEQYILCEYLTWRLKVWKPTCGPGAKFESILYSLIEETVNEYKERGLATREEVDKYIEYLAAGKRTPLEDYIKTTMKEWCDLGI